MNIKTLIRPFGWVSRKTDEWKPWYYQETQAYFTVITLHRFLRRPKVLYRYEISRRVSLSRHTTGINQSFGKIPIMASTDKYHGEVDSRYRDWFEFKMLDPNTIPRVPYTGFITSNGF
jgi:hypothetical protein